MRSVAQPPRFAHEAQQHGRQAWPSATAQRDAGRAGQTEQIGRMVDVVAHLQLGVVAHVQTTLRPAAPKGQHTGSGQIVRMDVVGEHVVLLAQHRRAALQAPARCAPFAVQARRYRECATPWCADPLTRPQPNTVASASTRRRARAVRATRRRFRSPRRPDGRHRHRWLSRTPAPVARCAASGHSPAHGCADRRGDAGRRSRRRRQVQHPRGQTGQALRLRGSSRSPISGVMPQARKLGDPLGAGCEGQQTHPLPAAEHAHRALAHVPTTDDEHPFAAKPCGQSAK